MIFQRHMRLILLSILGILLAGSMIQTAKADRSSAMTGAPLPELFRVPLFSPESMDNVTQVVAGINHSCALLNNGSVQCWGRNDSGQLGNDGVGASSVPVAVVDLAGMVTTIAAGQDHTCALLSTGTVQCWGRNDFGQLGDGTTINRARAVTVSGLQGTPQMLTGGYAHSCAVMTGGIVRCWGRNKHGQLGNGTTTDSKTPVTVTNLNATIQMITSGDAFNCVLLQNSAVYCWGHNAYGQIGNGTVTDQTTPYNVGGIGTVTTIGAGDFHVCAASATSNLLYCWGNNEFGQIGDGTTLSRSSPTIVNNSSETVALITGGFNHTCAKLTDGTMRCWGQNNAGQLGDNSNQTHFTPVAVANLNNIGASITAGTAHTCAMLADTTLRCWGENGSGQVGDGTNIDRIVPVTVSGLGDPNTPTHTPTTTPTFTPTPTHTSTNTVTPTATDTATSTPTPSLTNTPSLPITATPTATGADTSTPTPTPTDTPFFPITATPTATIGGQSACGITSQNAIECRAYLPLIRVPVQPTVQPTPTFTPTTSWQRFTKIPPHTDTVALLNSHILVGNRNRENSDSGGMLYQLASCELDTAPMTLLTGFSIRDIAVSDRNVLVGTDGNNLYYANDGVTMKRTEVNIEKEVIAVAFTEGGDHAYAGTDRGVYHSTDKGATWNFIEPTGPTFVNALLYDAGANLLWIATYNDGVWQLPVGSNSFSSQSDGLPNTVDDQRIWAIAQQGNKLYIGTNNGIYIRNGNEPWKAFGLQGLKVLSIAAIGDVLYAGIENGGIWTIALNSPSTWTVLVGFPSITVRAIVEDHSGFCNNTENNRKAILVASDQNDSAGVWIYR